MSSVGLSNLYLLKTWLLPASLLTGTDYDAQISAIGKGVAGALEKHCNRLFARTASDTFECPANRLHVVLPRYPLDAVPTLEQRDNLTDGYVAVTLNDVVIDYNLKAGLFKFATMPGLDGSRLKFTYTGGYFFETLEPSAQGYPTATPSGSTALPDDLLLAWRLQCEHVWTQRDKLGLNIGEKQENTFMGALSRVKLLDGVIELLRPYVRYSLT